jgi:hypothetical protein
MIITIGPLADHTADRVSIGLFSKMLISSASRPASSRQTMSFEKQLSEQVNLTF